MSAETTPAVERAVDEFATKHFLQRSTVKEAMHAALAVALNVEEMTRAVSDDLYGQNAYLLLAVRRPGESSRDHADRIGQWAAEIIRASLLGGAS